MLGEYNFPIKPDFYLRCRFMTKRRPDKFVGCGVYAFPQAARLLGIRTDVVKRWCGERKGFAAVVNRRFQRESILTFTELMELHFVKMFRDEGVSLQTIRKAANAASRKFRTDHPFSVKRFDTDGKSVFATLEKKETDREIIEDLARGQLVFESIIRPFFRKLDYQDSADVERFWPLEKSGRVVLDPLRRFGQPIDAETGVSTEAIINAIDAGGGQDPVTVATWLDIPLESVQAAISFERSLVT